MEITREEFEELKQKVNDSENLINKLIAQIAMIDDMNTFIQERILPLTENMNTKIEEYNVCIKDYKESVFEELENIYSIINSTNKKEVGQPDKISFPLVLSDNGFRYSKWGDSREDVEACEPLLQNRGWKYGDDESYIIDDILIEGVPTEIVYVFDEDGFLEIGLYRFDTFNVDARQFFKKIKRLLRQKYGNPNPTTSTSNEGEKGYASWGNGDSFINLYEVGRMIVLSILFSDDSE